MFCRGNSPNIWSSCCRCRKNSRRSNQGITPAQSEEAIFSKIPPDARHDCPKIATFCPVLVPDPTSVLPEALLLDCRPPPVTPHSLPCRQRYIFDSTLWILSSASKSVSGLNELANSDTQKQRHLTSQTVTPFLFVEIAVLSLSKCQASWRDAFK